MLTHVTKKPYPLYFDGKNDESGLKYIVCTCKNVEMVGRFMATRALSRQYKYVTAMFSIKAWGTRGRK